MVESLYVLIVTKVSKDFMLVVIPIIVQKRAVHARFAVKLIAFLSFVKQVFCLFCFVICSNPPLIAQVELLK